MMAPTPEEIRAARKAAGMTQKEAGELVGLSMTSWMRYETKQAPMDPWRFDYFLLLTGQKKLEIITKSLVK